MADVGAMPWEVVVAAAGAETPFVVAFSAGGVRGCVAGAEPCGWLTEAM